MSMSSWCGVVWCGELVFAARKLACVRERVYVDVTG